MKTIKQQVSVEFKVAEFEDKLAILPIMNQLRNDMIRLVDKYSIYKKGQDTTDDVIARITTLYRQYQVLSDFGFRSSMPLELPAEIMKRIKESGL